MSIAIGDILALTQLAWNLYRKCYVVGKDAPSEFLNLTSEIATLSQSLKMLEEELANPESILVRAGEDRQRMVAEMVRRVGGTLGELERFAGKYAGLGRGAGEKGEKGGGGGWRKRFWEKFKWSLDAADMEGLRSKLVYHNGVISLLLTSVGNSSLQRIEENHGRLERKLSEINQYVQKIGDNSRLPASQSISPSTTINSNHPSHIDDPTLSTLRSPVLSAILMKNAEVGERRWSAIGIDEWIQAGKWWLLKSQATTQISEEGKRQRYVDLLKASWIVVDVVAKHPQLNSLDPGAQVEAALLAEAITHQLHSLDKAGFVGPSLEEILAADLRVWERELPRKPMFSLPGKPPIPSSLNSYSASQGGNSSDRDADPEMNGGHVIMHSFATFLDTGAASSKHEKQSGTPCVILFVRHAPKPPGQSRTPPGSARNSTSNGHGHNSGRTTPAQKVHVGGEGTVIVRDHNSKTLWKGALSGFTPKPGSLTYVVHYHQALRFSSEIDVQYLCVLSAAATEYVYRCIPSPQETETQTLQALAFIYCYFHGNTKGNAAVARNIQDHILAQQVSVSSNTSNGEPTIATRLLAAAAKLRDILHSQETQPQMSDLLSQLQRKGSGSSFNHPNTGSRVKFRNSFLMWAIGNGFDELTLLLLELKGATIGVMEIDRCASAAVAAANADIEMLEILARENTRLTADVLDTAARMENPVILKWGLEHASLADQESLARNVGLLCDALVVAVKNQSVECARILAGELGRRDAHELERHGEEWFVSAATVAAGYTGKVAGELLEILFGPELCSEEGPYGSMWELQRVLLLDAAVSGRDDATRVLWGRIPVASSLRIFNHSPHQVLLSAVQAGQTSTVQMLIELGANVSKNDHEVLGHAASCAKNTKEMVQLLINAGAIATQAVINRAIRAGDLEILQLLLAEPTTAEYLTSPPPPSTDPAAFAEWRKRLKPQPLQTALRRASTSMVQPILAQGSVRDHDIILGLITCLEDNINSTLPLLSALPKTSTYTHPLEYAFNQCVSVPSPSLVQLHLNTNTLNLTLLDLPLLDRSLARAIVTFTTADHSNISNLLTHFPAPLKTRIHDPITARALLLLVIHECALLPPHQPPALFTHIAANARLATNAIPAPPLQLTLSPQRERSEYPLLVAIAEQTSETHDLGDLVDLVLESFPEPMRDVDEAFFVLVRKDLGRGNGTVAKVRGVREKWRGRVREGKERK